MEPQIDFNLDGIQNINPITNNQIEKFTNIRTLVKNLKLIPADSVFAYSTVTFL